MGGAGTGLGYYDKAAHKKDPQFVETAIRFLQGSALNLPYINPKAR